VTAYAPDARAVEELVASGGPNLFYDSVENRKACCAARKVAPLGRALAGRSAWVTGLRRAQSVTRTDLARVEWDSAHGLVKLNPLVDWTLDQVKAALAQRAVPVNALHDRGYPSLGCAPCTRAVAPGEDERAGRWWWEHPEHKECGLHVEPAPDAKKTFTFAKLEGTR
jgi:phosphoadenosine phosphosulfate reductase